MNKLTRPLLFVAAAAALAFSTAQAAGVTATLAAIADSDHRSEANKARNKYRHPAATLSFFGIRPDMTVVEVSPGGGGWYTEILAPFLRDEGKLYAASYDPESEREYYRRNEQKYAAKLAAMPNVYDKVEVTVFAPPTMTDAAPDGSADMVVTFRNLHGYIGNGSEAAVMQAMYRWLKPGGILGVVQHRGDPDKPQDPKAESGYVREDLVIRLAESAGFRLVASSEINANPLDTRDHPKGVWTLPPGYAMKDVDREKYATIGESDRMTLKFIKPE